MHSGRSCLLEIINQTTSYPSTQPNDPTCSDSSATNFLSSILASERRSRCAPSTINITAYRIIPENKFVRHFLYSSVSRSFDFCCSHPHPTIAENFQTIPKYQRHTSYLWLSPYWNQLSGSKMSQKCCFSCIKHPGMLGMRNPYNKFTCFPNVVNSYQKNSFLVSGSRRWKCTQCARCTTTHFLFPIIFLLCNDIELSYWRNSTFRPKLMDSRFPLVFVFRSKIGFSLWIPPKEYV